MTTFNLFARESKANPSEKVPSPMTTAAGSLSSPAKIVEEMRNETAALMEENDRLMQEHSSLKQKLSNPPAIPPTTKSSHRSLTIDIWASKEKNQTLEKKLSTLEKKQKLRDLQLDDLELEQRQLMLNDKVRLNEQLMNHPALSKTSSITSADAAQESSDLSSQLFGLAQSNENLRREEAELKQKILMTREEIKRLQEEKR